MDENHSGTNADKMYAPSYQLLVTTPMAAIMLSGKAPAEWSRTLGSIGPIYAAAASGTRGEVSEALSTVSRLLKDGDALIRQYFAGESLDFSRMMEISATGADLWMCKLSDGEITKPGAIGLFTAIKAGLIAAVGDLRDEHEMIDQLIQTQDKIVEHISSLN